VCQLVCHCNSEHTGGICAQAPSTVMGVLSSSMARAWGLMYVSEWMFVTVTCKNAFTMFVTVTCKSAFTMFVTVTCKDIAFICVQAQG